MSRGKKDDSFNGITIEVDGKVIGKVKDWKPIDKPLPAVEPKEYPRGFDFLTTPPGEFEIQLGSEMWKNLVPSLETGKVHFPAAQIINTNGPSFVRAQLDMWGIKEGDRFPLGCLELLIHEMEAAGYRVWFDYEAGLDEDLCEEHGVRIERDFKFDYVTRGDKDNDR
jgi:hypothetical protein